MPIQYGGDNYGWLATQGGVADLRPPQAVLDVQKQLMDASTSGQDTTAYWDQLRPYFESKYDPELFKANQADYAKAQGDALIQQAGGVKVTPEQIQKMKDAQAGGGMYSVLDPSLNRAPDPAYAAKVAAYNSQYTNPTATNATDFLASLKNFGGTPATVGTPATTPNFSAATPGGAQSPGAANLPMMSYNPAPKAQNIPMPGQSFRGFGGGSFGGRGLLKNTNRRTGSNIPTSFYGRTLV